MKIVNRVLFFIAVIVVFFSCNDDNYVPKPLGYSRIDFPEKEYKTIDENMPYSFSIPVYSVFEKIANEKTGENWANININQLKATINITYWEINNNKEYLFEDARSMVYKHSKRAEFIRETPFKNEQNNVYGVLYELGGNSASNIQFVLTDSSKHFLRGALYFMSRPNADSLAPSVAFVKKDILELMESCKWNN